jgi:hypothetical protein
MAGVRPLATGDIPAVAQLFSRVDPGKRWTSAAQGARAVGFIGAAFVQRKKIPLTA